MPYVHRIDPVLVDVAGIPLWWYGLSYSLGFLQMYVFLRRRRTLLRLTQEDVLRLSVWFAVGVLAGGRFVEVAFDEWPFYRRHLWLIPAYWLGGMATHGLLAGAAASAWLFARAHGKRFLPLADAIVVPGALLLGLGRLGNFIDGQIVGRITDVPWAVQFPDATGFRHPVVLYDGLKNLLLVPYLLHVSRTNRTPGATAARFVFWYAFLRIVIDLTRDYPSHRLAIGTGQTLNIGMTLIGLVLLVRSRMRRLGRLRASPAPAEQAGPVPDAPERPVQRLAFALVLLSCLTIPSNWTQDVPARYGKRHPGLSNGVLYPRIDTRPPGPHSGIDHGPPSRSPAP